MTSVYQTKQTFWQRAKNTGKEAWKKGAPKVRAAAKIVGQKAIESGKWAAKEGYKAYKEGSKKPIRKKRKGRKGKKKV